MLIHKTVEGETWDLICKRYYKTEKAMHKLLEANPKLRNFYVLPANVEVVIPEVEVKTLSELPPWRR